MKNLSIYECICLNTVALDKTKVEQCYQLFRISIGKPVLQSTPPYALRQMALRWCRGAEQKAYLQNVQAMLKGGSTVVVEDGEERTRKSLISEMNHLANETTDPKLRGQLLMNVAALLKQANAPLELESRINYYLPPRCTEECSLYRKYKDEHPTETPDTGRGTLEE